MSNVIELHPKIDTVSEAISDAVQEDYDEIIIIGIKGNFAQLRWSKMDDQHKIVGLLQQAIIDILE